MASCAPLREGKGSPYEGGIRVPLIMRWPAGIKPGQVEGTPVHMVDYYPTFAALAGATPPAGHTLDGADLAPLLSRSGRPARDSLYWHMPTYTTMYGRTPCAVIRKGDWKLIHWFSDYLDPRGFTPDQTPYGKLVVGARTELYNLREDIGETRDFASARPEKAAELRAALEAWWKYTGAGFPTRNPDFDESAWWVIPAATPKPEGKPKAK